jgi:eukaryotic-like serine/threonine-protein kinase
LRSAAVLSCFGVQESAEKAEDEATQGGTETEGTATGSRGAEDPTPPSQPYAGGVEIGGRYRLTAQLGVGGMGEVWEAEHVVLRRTLAIKLLLGDEHDARHAERLQREAELVARLEHPNIVTVTDFGRVPDGRPYIVMERLRGCTLSQLLRERGALPWTQARDIAVQIAAGLACAHDANIIHRDLKPSNVFVLDDPHGRMPIKIIDFGLAKATVLGPQDRKLTRSGMVFGTPAYMAPEQARGDELDGGADIYALGAILFEMIAGRRLWTRASAPQLLYCHLFEAPPFLRSVVPDVPADLDVIVARCLCKDRALRFATADELRVALVGVGTGKGATFVPRDTIPIPAPELEARYAVGGPRVPVPAPPRWIVPLAVGGVVAVGVLGVVAVRADLFRSPSTQESFVDEPVIETPASAVPVAAPPTPPAKVELPPPPEPTPPVIEPVPDLTDAPTPTKPMAKPKAKPSRPRASEDPPAPAEPTVEAKPTEPPPDAKAPKKKGETFSVFDE